MVCHPCSSGMRFIGTAILQSVRIPRSFDLTSPSDLDLEIGSRVNGASRKVDTAGSETQPSPKASECSFSVPACRHASTASDQCLSGACSAVVLQRSDSASYAGG